MTAKEIVKRFLSDNGYRYQEEGENISFKYQLVKYVFISNASEKLIQLVILFYDVTQENRSTVLEIANRVNQEKAMVKLTVDNDSVWINCEDIIDEKYSSEKIGLMLDLMGDALDRFYKIECAEQ